MTNTDTDADIKSLAKRIEALMDEKEARAEDIREVYTEAKSAGHDVKALRAAIRAKRAREKAPAAYDEAEEARERVLAALGAFGDTPLGDATIKRAAENFTRNLAKAGMRVTGAEGGSLTIQGGAS